MPRPQKKRRPAMCRAAGEEEEKEEEKKRKKTGEEQHGQHDRNIGTAHRSKKKKENERARQLVWASYVRLPDLVPAEIISKKNQRRHTIHCLFVESLFLPRDILGEKKRCRRKM
ncbi:hypothetical protein OUZ56_001758 [Daphnia magna]|uniref:Uncharacterized protein n=1 Tax=Daphnia magna TaxID=35525 RepID=A0ABR0A457_9CRUS|nr:hypothetical protein OUZ56_001758 [Daphnia magna]